MSSAASHLDPVEQVGEAFVRVGRELAISSGSENRRQSKHRAQQVRKALYDPEFERMAFDTWAPTLIRLAGIAALQTEAFNAGLLPRDRDDIAAELDRVAFRILLRTELIQRLLQHPVEPHIKVAALLELVARGILTRGRCARLALDTARELLSTPELRVLLITTPKVRRVLSERLEEAEARADRSGPTAPEVE